MSLKEKIESDSKAVLKSGEKDKLSALRLLMAAIKNAEIEKRKELTDEEIFQVIAREARKWEEAALIYKEANEIERAKKEEFQTATIKAYLPPQLSEEEISGIIKAALIEAGAKELKDIGRVMQIIMPKVKGKADGKRVNELVKEMLSG